jgi:hypothetical protein
LIHKLLTDLQITRTNAAFDVITGKHRTAEFTERETATTQARI